MLAARFRHYEEIHETIGTTSDDTNYAVEMWQTGRIDMRIVPVSSAYKYEERFIASATAASLTVSIFPFKLSRPRCCLDSAMECIVFPVFDLEKLPFIFR